VNIYVVFAQQLLVAVVINFCRTVQ